MSIPIPEFMLYNMCDIDLRVSHLRQLTVAYNVFSVMFVFGVPLYCMPGNHSSQRVSSLIETLRKSTLIYLIYKYRLCAGARCIYVCVYNGCFRSTTTTLLLKSLSLTQRFAGFSYSIKETHRQMAESKLIEFVVRPNCLHD